MKNPIINLLNRIRRPHPDAPDYYAYHAGRLFTPGAEIQALQLQRGTAVHLVKGNGTEVSKPMRATEGPQLWQNMALPSDFPQGATPVGTLYTQGLTNSDYTTPEGGQQ